MKPLEAFVIFLILVSIAVGVWWFFIREKDTVVNVEDESFMIGRIYGTSNLSTVYEFLDANTVKHVQDTNPCTLLSWELKTASTLEITGKGVFTIQSDALKSADGKQYIRLTGDISAYCALVGENV